MAITRTFVMLASTYHDSLPCPGSLVVRYWPGGRVEVLGVHGGTLGDGSATLGGKAQGDPEGPGDGTGKGPDTRSIPANLKKIAYAP